jgi:hypothetical protein
MTSLGDLRVKLVDINAKISPLVQQKQEIIRLIAVAEKIAVVNTKASTAAGIIEEISSFKHLGDAKKQIKRHLKPYMHNLPHEHFKKTHEVWSKYFILRWTRAQAVEFFTFLSKALEEDVCA